MHSGYRLHTALMNTQGTNLSPTSIWSPQCWWLGRDSIFSFQPLPNQVICLYLILNQFPIKLQSLTGDIVGIIKPNNFLIIPNRFSIVAKKFKAYHFSPTLPQSMLNPILCRSLSPLLWAWMLGLLDLPCNTVITPLHQAFHYLITALSFTTPHYYHMLEAPQ